MKVIKQIGDLVQKVWEQTADRVDVEGQVTRIIYLGPDLEFGNVFFNGNDSQTYRWMKYGPIDYEPGDWLRITYDPEDCRAADSEEQVWSEKHIGARYTRDLAGDASLKIEKMEPLDNRI